jgi:hypothetical protein
VGIVITTAEITKSLVPCRPHFPSVVLRLLSASVGMLIEARQGERVTIKHTACYITIIFRTFVALSRAVNVGHTRRLQGEHWDFQVMRHERLHAMGRGKKEANVTTLNMSAGQGRSQYRPRKPYGQTNLTLGSSQSMVAGSARALGTPCPA